MNHLTLTWNLTLFMFLDSSPTGYQDNSKKKKIVFISNNIYSASCSVCFAISSYPCYLPVLLCRTFYQLYVAINRKIFAEKKFEKNIASEVEGGNIPSTLFPDLRKHNFRQDSICTMWPWELHETTSLFVSE